MDAEKNVVEAARAVVATRGWDLLGGSHEKIVALRAALSAYDSAPAPSEDRVREAAGRCVRALLMDSRCTEGGWLAIKKRGSDGNEHDLGAWSHDAALNVIAEALRPYVTPAPALPAGTVVARLEWLRLMLTVAKQRDCTEIVDEIEGFLAKLPRPEPPKEFVAEWERIADTLYRYQIMSPRYDGPTKETHCARTVAALRAAWEADPKGKQ
jgi:hypothetical protein